jgi:hypothetical protein
MAVITVQDGSAGYAANAAAYVAATAGGDTVAGGIRAGGWHIPVVLLVRNTDAATRTVTVGSLPGVVVPATTGVAVIPVVGSPYGGAIPVTYSSAVGVTVAAARLTNPLE